MAVVTRTSAAARSNSKTTRTPDEYEGIYINPGIFVGTEEDKKFLRFNRGVAVSDLVNKKIYSSMDEDFAAETMLLNERYDAIRERALELSEGEYVVLNVPVVIYRRQEEAEVAPTPKKEMKTLRSELFGE